MCLKHENVSRDHGYCHVEMPNKDNNISKYNQGKNFMKAPFIIYADMESLLEKTSTCHNNSNESSTTKIKNHTPSGYSLFALCSFDNTKNLLSHYRSQQCMKKFCKDLKQHAIEIINCEEREMPPLTHEENESYKNQKVCCICKKGFITFDDDEKYYEVRDNCRFAEGHL